MTQVEALRDEELRASQAGEPSGFQRVLDALNVLGSTKWCDRHRSRTLRALAHATIRLQACQHGRPGHHGEGVGEWRRHGGHSRG
jgi:hypothetical protein